MYSAFQNQIQLDINGTDYYVNHSKIAGDFVSNNFNDFQQLYFSMVQLSNVAYLLLVKESK
jgi:hypothetical protein